MPASLAGSASDDAAASTVPFAVGMASLLILPLLIAATVAWCCCMRDKSTKDDELLPAPDDSEEAALQPSEMLDDTRPRSSRLKSTPVHFRKADWRSCASRPLTVRIPLDGASSLPELHAVLRRAYRQASKQQQTAGSFTKESLTSNESQKNLAFAVTYRGAQGKPTQVTASTDLKELAAVKSLYVTVSVPKRDVVAAEATAAATAALADEEAPNCDEEESDTASAVSMAMVDLSLAGCCGVKSTCGGLAITSDYTAPTLHRKVHRTRRQRQPAASKRPG